MTRICITGGPRTGKTTLAHAMQSSSIARGEIAPGVISTDDYIQLGWSEASAAVAAKLDEPGPWIIEGVAVSRALRKWRDAHPGEPPPCDRVIYLDEPYETLIYGQRVMSSGVRTVHAEIEAWLESHGAVKEYVTSTSQGDIRTRNPMRYWTAKL